MSLSILLADKTLVLSDWFMKFIFFLTSCFCFLFSSSVSNAEEIDFTRDVRPLLSGRCFKCHGPDPETRESGLRLDESQAAQTELDSGERAIVPGKITASELIARITSDDEFTRMPPPGDGLPLSEKEINTLKQWIEQGANYDKHWSFNAPQEPEHPEVSNPDWSRNGIDYFILQKLDQQGLKPSPEADRRTLIRRLSLNLTGLPPTRKEIDAFLNDQSVDAYENVVDRLLNSHSYGERWARIWLDLARYADSAGYADDPPRTIWKYRDWVIDSINKDMPIDQFSIEQMAGDLLPNPTDEQLIATAFHRNTMTNSEGGTDDEEFRSAAIVDRVNTSLQVWMGLTMACAQCHTHKYDPITQEEYFNVYAILNQTEDADRRNEAPLFEFWTPELEQKKLSLENQLAKLKTNLTELEAFQPPEEQDLKLPEGPVQARYIRVDLPGEGKMLSLAEVQVFSAEENIAAGKKTTQSSTGFNGPASLAVDGNTDGHFFDAKSTTHTLQEKDPWWEVDLGEVKQIEKVLIWNRTDSPGIGARLNGFRIVFLDGERKPIWAREKLTANENDTNISVPATSKEFLKEDLAAIANFSGQSNPEVDKLKKMITAVEKQIQGIKPVTVPVMRELATDKHRKTNIQIRGDFLDLGPEVTAGVLKSFHPIEAEAPTRLDFAKWLVTTENPLTARVFANRYWEALFGLGLVETSEDFGMQGELPSHPALLDWLAIQLIDKNWQRKEFLKLIVMSATYRQSSNVDSHLIEIDPKNRLLARGPRFRLSAEMIRDQALAVSGLLSEKLGGPSVNPPRPKLNLRAAFGGSTDWETSQGEDKFRRGLYTTWRRSMPYPSMDAFDAPSREVCTVRRIRTNTPLQALVTLNDPVYIEAAEALAGRILNEGGESDSEKLKFGFELCTAREANAQELEVLHKTFQALLSRFSQNEAEAEKLKALNMNENSQASAITQAAWTVLANVLLNLDETLTVR
jgi:hypothetical protein